MVFLPVSGPVIQLPTYNNVVLGIGRCEVQGRDCPTFAATAWNPTHGAGACFSRRIPTTNRAGRGYWNTRTYFFIPYRLL